MSSNLTLSAYPGVVVAAMAADCKSALFGVRRFESFHLDICSIQNFLYICDMNNTTQKFEEAEERYVAEAKRVEALDFHSR